MIITPATRTTDAAGAGPTQWTSLARRGMLWSEVQVFDVTVMAARTTGPDLDPDCYELLYCAGGAISLATPAGSTLRLLPGQFLIIAPGEDAVTVTVGGDGATLLRVRALPVTTSRQLPARQPSLNDSDKEPIP